MKNAFLTLHKFCLIDLVSFLAEILLYFNASSTTIGAFTCDLPLSRSQVCCQGIITYNILLLITHINMVPDLVMALDYGSGLWIRPD